MSKLHCLYVDDNSADRKRFERFLRNAWSRLRSQVELDISVAASPDAALEIFAHSSFELLLVDIMFGKEAAGLELIREARQRFQSAAIIGISIKADYREDALAVGADDFVTKPYIAGRDLVGEHFERVIRRALKAHGRDYLLTDEVSVVYDDRDLALTADLEDIGKAHFAALVVPLVGRSCDEITVERVRPGFSGSVVFRALCQVRVPEGQPKEVRDLIIKATRERDLLEREVARWESLASFPSELFVRNVTGIGISEAGGWFAIASQFQQRARTALDWLVEDLPADDKIEGMLRWLFVDSGLPAFYDRQTIDRVRRPNEAILSILTTSRRARALAAVARFRELGHRYAKGVIDAETLTTLIKVGRIGSIEVTDVEPGVSLCRCHGDLHTRNVLVGVHEHPRLIDPANVAVMPLYSDLARFVADLFVSAWDAGDVEYELERIPVWCEVARALVCETYELTTPRNGNRAAWTALTWLLRNRMTIYPHATRRWQWTLALVVEFLRCAYRQDLTAPKRILSLGAASLALKQCESEYRRGE